MNLLSIIIWFCLFFIIYDMYKKSINYYLHQAHHSNYSIISNLSYVHYYRHRFITPSNHIIPSYLTKTVMFDLLIKNILLQIPFILSIKYLNKNAVNALYLIIILEWLLILYDYFYLDSLVDSPSTLKNNIEHHDDCYSHLSPINYRKLFNYLL
jgi:hypothetical protein